MPNKKRIYQSISTKQSLPKKSNKIKLIFLCITFSFGMFLIIQNSKKIHLDGSWNATKIIINDQNLLLYDTIFRNFDISNQYISIWGHSIKINPNEQKIIADFKIEKDNQGNNYMILSSRKNSLNGKFKMKIDTTHTGPQSYTVLVKLHLNKTYLYFQKDVVIQPWKPEPPRRGIP